MDDGLLSCDGTVVFLRISWPHGGSSVVPVCPRCFSQHFAGLEFRTSTFEEWVTASVMES